MDRATLKQVRASSKTHGFDKVVLGEPPTQQHYQKATKLHQAYLKKQRSWKGSASVAESSDDKDDDEIEMSDLTGGESSA